MIKKNINFSRFLSVDVKPKALEGVLAKNDFLENPEKLLLGKIDGAETLIAKNGAIYATVGNGDVVKIVGDKMSVLGSFGTPYSELKREIREIVKKFFKTKVKYSYRKFKNIKVWSSSWHSIRC